MLIIPSWLIASALAANVNFNLVSATSHDIDTDVVDVDASNNNNYLLRGRSSEDIIHHRDLASPFKSSECAIELISYLEVEPGSMRDKELQLACIMDKVDAKGKSNHVLEISGTKEQMKVLKKMVDDQEIEGGGKSVLQLGNNIISMGSNNNKKDKLVLGMGFNPKSHIIKRKNRKDKKKNKKKGPWGTDSRHRHLAKVTGNKPMLAVKVIDVNGLARYENASVISDDIFGTYGDPVNLRSQLNDCSMGKLNVTAGDDGRDIIPSDPTSGKVDQNLYDAPGVVVVNINVDITDPEADVRNAVTDAVQEKLGFTLPGPYEQVLYVLEGCYGSCGWAAYAYIDSWLSVYQSEYYKQVGVLVHELGHNFALAHSGMAGGGSYEDHTGEFLSMFIQRYPVESICTFSHMIRPISRNDGEPIIHLLPRNTH